VKNKRAFVGKIIAQLDAELEGYAKSARAAHADATDPQNKAENKYDTRGLEASYLAHGQSRQAAETEQARQQYLALPLRDFGKQEAIDLGAFVELAGEEGSAFYFLGPSAGGAEIAHDKKTVLVITPVSPLGRQLVGLKHGDRAEIGLAGSRRVCRVAAVS
jgi:transcription elongation GreA/GreB family factor